MCSERMLYLVQSAESRTRYSRYRFFMGYSRNSTVQCVTCTAGLVLGTAESVYCTAGSLQGTVQFFLFLGTARILEQDL